MILPIYIYGQPVLRQVAEDITPDSTDLKVLINNMYETLDSSNGIGLAAPQIGLPIRLVVIDVYKRQRYRKPQDHEGQPYRNLKSQPIRYACRSCNPYRHRCCRRYPSRH